MNKHFEFMFKYLVIGCVSIFILLFACISQSVWGADDLPVPVKDKYYIHSLLSKLGDKNISAC